MSSDRGSVLMLMPAAVLVLVVLGAIAVDFAVLFLGQRELLNATAAAANDAAVAALEEEAFYTEGQLRLNPERARAMAQAALAGRSSSYVEAGLESVSLSDVDGERVRVTVRARAQVDMIFSKGIPGAPHRRDIQALSTATATRE